MAMLEHVKAAEHARRQRARQAGGEDRARFEHHAELLSQIQRDFQEHRSVRAPSLDGSSWTPCSTAQTLYARRRTHCGRPPGQSWTPAEHEAMADELERSAKAILRLDRDLT